MKLAVDVNPHVLPGKVNLNVILAEAPVLGVHAPGSPVRLAGRYRTLCEFLPRLFEFCVGIQHPAEAVAVNLHRPDPGRLKRICVVNDLNVTAEVCNKLGKLLFPLGLVFGIMSVVTFYQPLFQRIAVQCDFAVRHLVGNACGCQFIQFLNLLGEERIILENRRIVIGIRHIIDDDFLLCGSSCLIGRRDDDLRVQRRAVFLFLNIKRTVFVLCFGVLRLCHIVRLQLGQSGDECVQLFMIKVRVNRRLIFGFGKLSLWP